jgi:hypothetical protein
MNDLECRNIITKHQGVLYPEYLLSLYGGDIFQWKDVLINLFKEGLLSNLYRLNNNNKYDSYDNEWVSSLGTLANNFKIKNSLSLIDGSDPENIEVAFILKS